MHQPPSRWPAARPRNAARCILSAGILIASHSSLHAQSAVSPVIAGKHKPMLVQIGGGPDDLGNGRGYIVGYDDLRLSILTPRHVLEDYAKTRRTALREGSRVELRFHADAGAGSEAAQAVVKRLPTGTSPDIALLEMEKPSGFRPSDICIMPERLIRPPLQIKFLGRKWDGYWNEGIVVQRREGARETLSLSGLNTVDNGDSGGPVFSSSGLIALLQWARANGEADADDIHFLKEWVVRGDKTAWSLPTCTPEAILTEPESCERGPSPACWTKLAGDVFLAAPKPIETELAKRLAASAALHNSPDEVERVLEAAVGPAQKVAMLIGASWASIKVDSKAAMAFADRASREADSLESKQRLDALAELAGVYSRLDEAKHRAAAARVMEQARVTNDAPTLARLAYFTFLGGNENAAWQYAGEMRAALLPATAQTRNDGEISKVRDAVSGIAYYAVPFHEAAAVVRSLRLLSMLPPSPGWRGPERASIFESYGILLAYRQVAERYTRLGDLSAALMLARTEWAWWREGRPFPGAHAHRALAHWLAESGLFADAVKVLQSDLVFDREFRSDLHKDVRLAGDEIESLSQVANTALEKNHPSVRALFETVRVFEAENRLSHRQPPLDLYADQVRRLARGGLPDEASAAYWEFLSAVSRRVEERRLRFPGAFAGGDPLAETTDYALPADIAFLAGVELPAAIAEAYRHRARRDDGQMMLEIVSRFATNTTFRYAPGQLEAEMRNVQNVSAQKRAGTMFAYLAKVAPKLFDGLDRGVARTRYARALIRMGEPERGLEALGDAKARFLTDGDFVDDLFAGYATQGNQTAAAQFFKDSKPSPMYRLIGASASFPVAWAYAAARVRRLDIAELAYSRIREQGSGASSADLYNLAGEIVRQTIPTAWSLAEVKQSFSSIERMRFEGEVLASAAAQAIERAVAFGDPAWGRNVLFKYRRELAARAGWVRHNIRLMLAGMQGNGALLGASKLVLQAYSADHQVELFLDLAQ